jgi:Mrp family chromosome partitioning ATPase
MGFVPRQGVSPLLHFLASGASPSLAAFSVLFIDANLENPAFSAALGFEQRPGVAEMFRGELSLPAAVVRLPRGFDFLPAGGAKNRRSAPIDGQNTSQLLAEAKTRYDIVFIDTPPLAQVARAGVIAHCADIVIIAIASGSMHVRCAEHYRQLLAAYNCTVAGAVITHFRHVIPPWLYEFT